MISGIPAVSPGSRRRKLLKGVLILKGRNNINFIVIIIIIGIEGDRTKLLFPG